MIGVCARIRGVPHLPRRAKIASLVASRIVQIPKGQAAEHFLAAANLIRTRGETIEQGALGLQIGSVGVRARSAPAKSRNNVILRTHVSVRYRSAIRIAFPRSPVVLGPATSGTITRYNSAREPNVVQYRTATRINSHHGFVLTQAAESADKTIVIKNTLPADLRRFLFERIVRPVRYRTSGIWTSRQHGEAGA